ncbi:MAG TPA: lipoyl(octanoyl) transferase LipB [Acidiferrobacterales bacterium]|jgi:lipoyl(octanoyl) transferase
MNSPPLTEDPSGIAPADTPRVRRLGVRNYVETWRDMQAFTARRDTGTADEIWLLEHPPVYTLGLNAKHGEFVNPAAIPVIRTDRGGDITYHGPGQLVAYVLIDLRRRRLGIKALVAALEQSVLDLLAAEGIRGERRPGAPGVYVDGRKLAQLGLRVRGGACYHGLSLNVAMDLAPFDRINPCGYPELAVTQLADLLPGRAVAAGTAAAADRLLPYLLYNLGYNSRPNDGPVRADDPR